MQAADLATVRGPYLAIAAVVNLLFLVFTLAPTPPTIRHDEPFTARTLAATLPRLASNPRYIGRVVAQAFCVGAQIMTWTFIIHYGMTAVGLTAAQAQNCNILAMLIYLTNRFACTAVLGVVRPSALLGVLALGGVAATAGTILLDGWAGLASLIAISACMSLMFPTICGIAPKDLVVDASIGSAGLVMAIVGGALMPVWQGAMIDAGPIVGSIPAVKTSFLLPMGRFIVIAVYTWTLLLTRRD